MNFKTPCPHCGQRYEATDEHIGIELCCSNCSSVFTIKNPLPVAFDDMPILADETLKKVQAPQRDSNQVREKKSKGGFFSSLFNTRDVVKHTIRFGKFGTHGVKTDWYAEADEDMLAASLLLYMSMYFYAGEHRVVEATTKELIAHLEEERDPDQLTEDIFYAIKKVFKPIENDAVDGVFEYGKPFWLDGYESFERKDDIIKTISTTSLKSGDRWLATISVRLGLDVVVLPLGIGILYNFISEQLDDLGRAKLQNAMVDLCILWAKGEFKKLEASRNATNNVIRKIWGLYPS